MWISNCHFFLLNCLEFVIISSNLTAYSFVSSSKVCSSRTASVAEGDFRRVENLDFFPSSVKKKKKTKSKTRKKKRITQSLLSCKKIICVKSPVLSFIQSVSQSVSKTDYQSIFRLAAKLGRHIAVSETVNQLFWRLTSIRSVSWSSSQLVGWKVAQSFWSASQTVSQSAG